MDQFIPSLIKFVISNFPILMTATAILIAIMSCRKDPERSASDIFLTQLMFFAVGLSGLWGFIMHAFFPELAASAIGWTVSPFQFEVAVANLGMGLSGLFGLHSSRSYRIAVTIFTSCFLWGAALGHIMQMIKLGNFAPGNAGPIFYNDIILPALLIIFLLFRKKNSG